MRKTSAPEWAKRVRRWKRSGMTAREFGQRHGIDPRQLSWWKWKLKKRGELADLESSEAGESVASSTDTAIRLLPVQVVHAESARDATAGRSRAAVVEVGLRNGRVVRVAEEVDFGWLAELLSVVEGDGASGC